MDEVAFNHLFAGEIDKAEEIWQKKDTASSLQNRIVYALMRELSLIHIFKGSVVSYTNEIKERLLKVDHQLLEEKTAVGELLGAYLSESAQMLSL